MDSRARTEAYEAYEGIEEAHRIADFIAARDDVPVTEVLARPRFGRALDQFFELERIRNTTTKKDLASRARITEELAQEFDVPLADVRGERDADVATR